MQAFFAKGRALAKLFLTARAASLDKVWKRIKAWPPGPKNAQWPGHASEYGLTVGYAFSVHDPPPATPPQWAPPKDGKPPPEEESLWDEVEYWCQLQVCRRCGGRDRATVI